MKKLIVFLALSLFIALPVQAAQMPEEIRLLRIQQITLQIQILQAQLNILLEQMKVPLVPVPVTPECHIEKNAGPNCLATA